MRTALLRKPGAPVEETDRPAAPREGGLLWVDAEGPVRESAIIEGLKIPDRIRPYLSERPTKPHHTISPMGVAASLAFVDRDFPPLRSTPITVLLGDGWLLTVTWGKTDAVDRAWEERTSLLPLGVDMILLAILGPLLDDYGEIVDSLVHRGEVIDGLVLKGAPRLYEDIHRVRREALSLRKLVQPQMDAMEVLRDHHIQHVDTPDGEPYLEDLVGRLRRLSTEIDAVRDGMMAVVESYASVVSNHMNRVMKLLTVVSVVFLPATLIASIYGMNFLIPEYHWHFGYWYSLGLMAVVSTCILFYMHAKGWFS